MWPEPVTRHELLRKAKDPRTGFGGFGDAPYSQTHGLLRRCGKAKVGESNSNHIDSLDNLLEAEISRGTRSVDRSLGGKRHPMPTHAELDKNWYPK